VDTRTKIVEGRKAQDLVRQLSQDGFPLKVVAGYFDPLLAAHVRRLEQIAGAGGRVVVLLETPKDPLLPSRARAELVAALGAVEYVVLAEKHLDCLPAAFVVREEEADELRRRDLIRQVLTRQLAKRE
jgi:bifunctional ADP-heptose synthase (sugar kinase/adenylyltransferase)